MPGFGFGCWLLLLQSMQCTHRNRKEFSSVSLSVELLGMFSSCARHV